MSAPGSRASAAPRPEPERDTREGARREAPARDRTADLLVETRRTVERVLGTLPRNVVEAREQIADELWPDPRPEELQAIIGIASDDVSTGPRRDLPLHLLALRSRVERTLARYRVLTSLELDDIRKLAESLRLLAAATSALDRVMGAAVTAEATGSRAQRDRLRQIHETLAPPRETLASAAALAPMLVRLAEACANDELTGLFEEFAPEDAAVLARFSPGADEAPRPFDREALETCCLRWLVSEDLRARPEAPPSRDPGAHEAFARRLRIDVAVYQRLSDRLQVMQDSAIAARQEEVAERLGRFRRLLFSTYQRLAEVMREIAPSEDVKPVLRPEPESTGRTRRTNRKADAERDRALRSALAGANSGETPERPEPELRPHRYPWKLHAALVAVAALMNVFWVFIPTGPPPRIETTVADYASAAELQDVASIGTLLYARVDSAWASRPEADLLAELEAIGALAAGRGFAAVRVADAAGAPLGDWTTDTGASLAGPPAGLQRSGADQPR